MKKQKKRVAEVSLLLLSAFPLATIAQDFSIYPTSNRDENGKIIRSNYVTNEWYDQLEISAGAGISTYTTKGNSMMLSPVYELAITKWAIPSLAFRFGLQGFQGKEKFTPDFTNHSVLPYDPSTNTVSWDYLYAHADIMWCASNTFFGYSFRRFYSFIPYIHGGYQRMFDPKNYKSNYDHEAVIGAGLLNSFRIADRVSLTIDLMASNFSGRFHHDVKGSRVTQLSASAGLAFKIFKPGWRRANEIEKARDAAARAEKDALERLRNSELAYKSLSEDNAMLQARIRENEEEMNVLKAVAAEEAKARQYEYDELLRRIAGSDLVIYYDINADVLRHCEEIHIDEYVRDVLNVDPDHIFYITGSADKGTGSFEVNDRISNNRVIGVKNYLMKHLGIREDRIVVRGAIVTDKHTDGRLDRSVLFESK